MQLSADYLLGKLNEWNERMEQQYTKADAVDDFRAVANVGRTGIAALNSIAHFILGAKLLEQQAAQGNAEADVTALPVPSAPNLRASLETLVEGGVLLPSYHSTIGDGTEDNETEEAHDGSEHADTAS